MSKGDKESYKPYPHTTEGEKFFQSLVTRYGLEEDMEYIIVPLVNQQNEEKKVFILKTKEMQLKDTDSIDMEDYLKEIIADAAEDGFNLKTHEAQASEKAA